MSANNRNRLKTTVSAVASSGLGAFTISSASSGYRSFVAGDDGLTFDGVLITEGTTWEVRDGCVYTHSGTSLSRGTLMDSSTGSAIAFTSAAVVSQSPTATWANTLSNAYSNGFLEFDAAEHMQYVDTDTISITGGKAWVNGTWLSWSTQNKDCGPSGTSPMNAAGIKYVYLENSGGSAAFVVSATAPTWDATLRYRKGASDNQRLIGWIYVWNATTAGTYRIVPFHATFVGKVVRITYSSDWLSGSDIFDSNDLRLGSKSSTSTNDTYSSLTFSSLIPADCHEIFLQILIGGTVSDDSGRVNLSWSDYDGGTTGLGSISVRMEWRVGFIYLPHSWLPVTESGTIYYAVTRASGTGTITGYVDCWGGAIWD